MFENLVTTFTTTNAEEDILATQNGLRARICERLGIQDAELTERLNNHTIGMNVTIFAESNRVSIDNHLYQSFTDGKVYTSGRIYPKTIKLESAGSGTVMIEIRQVGESMSEEIPRGDILALATAVAVVLEVRGPKANLELVQIALQV